MEERQQEFIFKLSIYEQQIQQLQQQVQAVEQSLFELQNLTLGLDGLKESSGKEIMAPVGRGVFAEAKLISGELLVDVGSKNLVKKSIPETQKLILEQIKKLKEIKEELSKNIEDISNEAEKLVGEFQRKED